jgi:hypothetical protein
LNITGKKLSKAQVKCPPQYKNITKTRPENTPVKDYKEGLGTACQT